ncbi:hypothetical protein [Sodalis-like endosymbiont of Proechinophthirus fluctus]|uniref:hypothetical protein n=1 Tax=Sodalis-like endosymbiont of Proechinophthirus fluctus TaxID=1462730 RepID=UPI00082F05B0|nr:hypothetical protein [Sodalis-like endosymbiont of Proechinophthirus fluctus]
MAEQTPLSPLPYLWLLEDNTLYRIHNQTNVFFRTLLDISTRFFLSYLPLPQYSYLPQDVEAHWWILGAAMVSWD